MMLSMQGCLAWAFPRDLDADARAAVSILKVSQYDSMPSARTDAMCP